MFDKPSKPGRDDDAPLFVNAEHMGDVLVIHVVEHVASIATTANKPGETSQAIRADVTVINPDGTKGTEYPDTLLFGTLIVSSLRQDVGRTVVGVWSQGEKKPGKNAPWTFTEASDAQTEAAVRAMTGKPSAQPVAAAAVTQTGDKPPWEQ